MKVLKILGVAITLVVVIVISLLIVSSSQSRLGAYRPGSNNFVPSLTQTSTSTGSFTGGCAGTCPVKLLNNSSNLRYAIITNISDTTVYLTVTTTDLTVDGLNDSGEVAATSTITDLTGIPIVANGSFEILPEKLLYGDIWATSTGGIIKKAINISYYTY